MTGPKKRNRTLAFVLSGIGRTLKKWLDRSVFWLERGVILTPAELRAFVRTELQPELEKMLSAAAEHAARNSGLAVSWDRINEDVRTLARRRAFELISLQGPQSIVRPTVHFLDKVRDELATGELAWADLRLRLQKMFGPYRARLIARTETTTLWADSHMIAAVAAGMTDKRSRRATHRRPCPSSLCDDAEAEGWIPIRQLFRKSRKQGPAFHPSCFCFLQFKGER